MSVKVPMTGKNSEDKFAIVDDQDADLVQLAWYIYGGLSERATTNVSMHRMIMWRMLDRYPKKGEYIDHINRNPFDNRRKNLRVCTKSQDLMNSKKRQTYRGKKTTSRYKGVHYSRSRHKWVAGIKANGKSIFLGRFTNETEAAKAYNKAAEEHFGEFAYLNEFESD